MLSRFSILSLTLIFWTLPSFGVPTYPVAKKITQSEIRFGVKIDDPYKWMENASDPDLWNWIEEQKNLTRETLDLTLSEAFTQRVLDFRKIKKEQDQITNSVNSSPSPARPSHLPWNIDEHHQMGMKKTRFTQWRQRESLNYLKQLKLNSPPRTDSKTYKISLRPVYDGDLQRMIISKRDTNEVVDILLVKFYSFITWADDESFYYITDQDERLGGGKTGLYKHTVGDSQSEDELLFSSKFSNSDLGVNEFAGNFYVVLDGMIGGIQLSTGKVTNKFKFLGESPLDFYDPQDPKILELSFDHSNNGELYSLRLRDGKRTLLVPEQDFVLQSAAQLSESSFIVIGVQDSSMKAFILSKGELKQIAPELADGSLNFLSSNEDWVKLSYESYTQPKKVVEFNYKTGMSKVLATQTYNVEVEAEKIHYTASNGQKAALWVLKKKGQVLNAKTPTILYGYGGFRSNITPMFNMYECLPWLENGGVFAVVTLPGSMDYGSSWYHLAINAGRINSFNSFALAAKELFNRGWTSPEHIGMMGASNGGTLVAGTLQRHSNLFKAAVPIVGVMDLINFPLFTAGKYWTGDYGNPFIEKEFHGIFPLSPYHNLEKRSYPATMVMTAEFDDRVVPMHSYKYLARLQEFNTSEAPILLYNKEWGGHARASGPSKESSRYVSAFYTFFAQQLEL